jgi:hypothetical protein
MKTAIWCYFPLSAGISHITSWAISATWPVEPSRSRCYRPGSGMWLVVGWLLVAVLVGPRGRVGSVTPTPNGHLPARFMGVGFCPLDRAVGVNPRFSLRRRMRLVVLVLVPRSTFHGTKRLCESPQALASALCMIQALGPFSGNRPGRGSSLKVAQSGARGYKSKSNMKAVKNPLGRLHRGGGRSRLEHELEQANARRPAPSRGECICGKALGKSKRARGV